MLKVLETIKRHDLLRKGDRVLVGLSGGPDSVALVHTLYCARKALGISLAAAHLNHMIRGMAAKKDEEYVRAFCSKLKIPLWVKRVKVKEAAKREKLSLEDAGRRARYAFYEEASKAARATKIALGHSADDDVETVLMRLVTGTGTKGLLGIPSKRGKIIRPLIDTFRDEIESYCRSKGLHPRSDRSNFDTRFLRNKVRHKLVPLLTAINPRFKFSLKRSIDVLSADYEYLMDVSLKVFHGITEKASKGNIVLDIDKLIRCPESIRRNILRLAIMEVKGDLENITFDHIEDCLAKLPDERKWELHLPSGTFVSGDGDRLEIRDHENKGIPRVSFNYALKVPGRLDIREAGLKIRAALVENVSRLKLKTTNQDQVVVDYGKISVSLTVRNRREGDRFSPLGISGTKKLKDFFIDAKVPGEKKDLVPIVESAGRIVWVAGMRMDNAFRVTKDTKKAVRLTLSRI